MIFPIVAIESIVLAAIYLQIALAWIVIYRATRVLNFATGEMLLFSALVFSTLTVAGLHPVIAILAVVAIVAVFAMGVHDALLRPLAGRPVFPQILVTVGLSIVMASTLSMLWGNQARPVDSLIPKTPHNIFSAVLTTLDFVIIGLSLATYVALLLFLQRSRLGRQMRAAAEQPLLASQSGLNITRMSRYSWGIAGIAMVLAGVPFAHLTLVSGSIAELGLRGIAPALIGGLDNVKGALIGAITIALVENLSAVYFGGQVRNVVPFLVIMAVLLVRPYGLFGTPEVRRV